MPKDNLRALKNSKAKATPGLMGKKRFGVIPAGPAPVGKVQSGKKKAKKRKK